jgi:hypothetical protein
VLGSSSILLITFGSSFRICDSGVFENAWNHSTSSFSFFKKFQIREPLVLGFQTPQRSDGFMKEPAVLCKIL